MQKLPMIVESLLVGKVIPVNYYEKTTFYSVKLDDVTLASFHADDILFEEVEGSSQINVRMQKVTADITVNGQLDALNFIPFKASAVKLTNAAVSFSITPTSTDTVHWNLDENSSVTVEKVEIKMANAVLDKLVKLSSGIINKVIAGMLPKISKTIDQKFIDFNTMLTAETPTTFVLELSEDLELPLNLTMSSAPTVKDQFIDLVMDGRFVQPSGESVEQQQSFAQRIEGAQDNQLFIHESMINSLIKRAAPEFLKDPITDPAITKQMFQLFSKLYAAYGREVTLKLQADLSFGSDSPVTIRQDSGIHLGG
jgi:hypothetical protein